MWALAVGITALVRYTAPAQPTTRMLGMGGGMVDFAYAGRNDPDVFRYDYQGPVVALVYRQPSLYAMAALGTGRPALLDLAASGWVGRQLLDTRRYGLRVPVVYSVGYRRVDIRETGERWDATRIGLGVGVQWVPPRTSWSVRVHPTLSIVTMTLSSGYGLGPGAEAELARVVWRRRLELGYLFRFQVWNINLPGKGVDHHLDYRSMMHMIRAGLRF